MLSPEILYHREIVSRHRTDTDRPRFVPGHNRRDFPRRTLHVVPKAVRSTPLRLPRVVYRVLRYEQPDLPARSIPGFSRPRVYRSVCSTTTKPPSVQRQPAPLRTVGAKSPAGVDSSRQAESGSAWDCAARRRSTLVGHPSGSPPPPQCRRSHQ